MPPKNTFQRPSFSAQDLIEVVKRHGSTHYANIKYGYIVLALTIVHVLFIYTARNLYIHRWKRTGRSTSFKILDSIPKWAVITIWVLICLVLSFINFHPAHINVFIKRLGRISYVLIPLDVFLSLKPNPLPNVFYLELIFLHKWLSRLIVLISTIHGIGFTWKWIADGRFSTIGKKLNIFGVIGTFFFLYITVISLKPIRHRVYNLFFSSHLVLSWISIILLTYHARPGVELYSWLLFILFIAQFLTKIYKSENTSLEVESQEDSDLILVEFPNYFRGGFIAGSHIRLNVSLLNPLAYILPSHPYTIASTPNEKTIKLAIRRGAFELNTVRTYSAFGPFPSLPEVFFKTADNVLLIAGGSGISYALGVFQELRKSGSANIKLVWILRNKSDLWILDHFNVHNVDIYITKEAIISDDPVDDELEVEQLLENPSGSSGGNLDEDDKDDFELDELDPFDDSNALDGSKRSKTTIHHGRPNFKSYSPVVDQYDKANNWIISCGTKGMNEECEKWAKEMKVAYYSETYAM